METQTPQAPENVSPPAPAAPGQASTAVPGDASGAPINAQEQAAPPAPPAPPAQPAAAIDTATLTAMPPQAAETAPAEEKVLPADWPHRGYSGPQPWEAVNPPELIHNQRMISSGTHGSEVVELCALLARLGYTTPISTGQNPHAIYEAATAAAVRQFCTEYGVREDPAIVAAMTDDVVGPWTWEALFRAAHKAGQEQ